MRLYRCSYQECHLLYMYVHLSKKWSHKLCIRGLSGSEAYSFALKSMTTSIHIKTPEKKRRGGVRLNDSRSDTRRWHSCIKHTSQTNQRAVPALSLVPLSILFSDIRTKRTSRCLTHSRKPGLDLVPPANRPVDNLVVVRARIRTSQPQLLPSCVKTCTKL